MSEDTERVVYEESTRTISQQRDLLDGLRARAGTLLAAASLATAFLSAPALSRSQTVELIQGQPVTHARLTALSWVAIVLFCNVVLLTLVVLIPWRWTFAHHPHSLISVHLDPGPPSSITELYRNLSYWNGAHYDQNGWKLEAMLVFLALACASLAGEIVIWLLILGGI